MNALKSRLAQTGYKYNFFQAIKLLEHLYQERPRIGHIGPYEDEIVKVRPNDELSFSPSDVRQIELGETEDGEDKWTLIENFLGLYGPNSSTPMYLAEFIAQCPREEDPLRDFLDMFNHRILSLYYRAWKKHNLGASISFKWEDSFTKILYAMLGVDIEASRNEWIVPPERLLQYSSYFSSSSRPAAGLKCILSDFFDLDEVEITQFVPRRYSPPKDALSRLSSSGEGGTLGETFVIGETINDVFGQFKISLGSLSMEQFLSFQPGNPRYNELVFISNMYTKYQLGYTLELSLKPNQGGSMKLSNNDPSGAIGRSAWIGYPSETETTVTFEVFNDR